MTKNKAIELAYIEIIKHKFDEDAVQHCFELLLKKPDEFILDLQSRNELIKYVYKFIQYNIKLSYSQINYRETVRVEEHLDDEEWIEIQETIPVTNYHEDTINLKNISWFDARITELYLDMNCNLSAVSKKTLIPVNSIKRAVNRAIKKYKENEETRHNFFKR